MDFFLDLMTFYGDVTDVSLWFRLFMDVTNDDEPPSSPYLRPLRVGFLLGGFVGIGG